MAEAWNMPKGDLMRGKKGLVMGVANDKSIAWGIATQLAAQGADMAFSYMGESLLRRVQPLAESIGVKHLIECDVTSDSSMDSAFARLKEIYGEIDFVVHSIAFADKNELQGSFVDNTTRQGFLLAMNVSAFSFVDVSRRASSMMKPGGSLVTMTYLGAERTIPNYNTMGVAKAALEASVRYLANDFGPSGIRVNALSPGPVRTLAGAGISDARLMFNFQKRHAPLRRTVSLDDIGGSALYLLSDLSGGVTGEVHHVDSGYNIVSMPRPDVLKTLDAAEQAVEDAASRAAGEAAE